MHCNKYRGCEEAGVFTAVRKETYSVFSFRCLMNVIIVFDFDFTRNPTFQTACRHAYWFQDSPNSTALIR